MNFSLAKLVRTIRRVITLSLFLIYYNIFWYIGFCLTFPFKPLHRKWRVMATKALGTGILFCFGAKLHIKGLPPKKPFLLVSNHLSYIDIFVYYATAPCTLISKMEIGKWFMVGPIAKGLGTIFIDRGSKRDLLRINDLIERRLKENNGVIFFPEGTSSDGEMKRFKPSLFAYASEKKLPVYYSSIQYETLPGEGSIKNVICWWGDMTLLPHMYNLMRMPYFNAYVEFNPLPIAGEDRKELAHNVQEGVTKQLSEVKVFSSKET